MVSASSSSQKADAHAVDDQKQGTGPQCIQSGKDGGADRGLKSCLALGEHLPSVGPEILAYLQS